MTDYNSPEYTGLQMDPRIPSGMQALHNPEEKEVVAPPEGFFVPRKVDAWNSTHEPRYNEEKEVETAKPLPAQPQKKSRRRLWILLGLIAIIIVIAIVVPVAIVTSRASSSAAQPANSTSKTGTPASTPAPTSTSAPASTNAPLAVPDTLRAPSTSGAWNGTGLTSIPPFHGTDALWLFWQDFTGDIKLSTLDHLGDWQAPQSVGINNAANGTGLASLTHFVGPNGETSVQHLVYTTKDGFLADYIRKNASGLWNDGGLFQSRFTVPDPSLREPSQMAFVVAPNNAGDHLYATGNRGLICEYNYNANNATWARVGAIPESNGFGGLSAQTSSTLTTVHSVDTQGRLQMLWRDTALSEQWNTGADTTTPVAANSTLSAPVAGADTDLVYYLDEKSELNAARIAGVEASASWAAQTGTGLTAMVGTRIFAMALGAPGTPSGFTTSLFWQKNGSDIQYYTGGKAAFTLVSTVDLGS